jgi:hypothetical protein
MSYLILFIYLFIWGTDSVVGSDTMLQAEGSGFDSR